jgi:plasmid replication initiation protein
LAGTRIQTNIKTNSVEITSNFGLIESFTIIKENSKNKAIAVEVVLSEWFYNSILGNEVLTIHKDYFRLRKPTERRLYELARKHCGNQPSWKIKLSTIQEKIGITSQLKQFRYNIKAIIEDNHLPEYNISMENDVVTFSRKQPPKLISNYQFSKTTQAANTTEAINQSSNDEMNILDEYALARRRFGDIAVIPEEYVFILKQQGRW